MCSTLPQHYVCRSMTMFFPSLALHLALHCWPLTVIMSYHTMTSWQNIYTMAINHLWWLILFLILDKYCTYFLLYWDPGFHFDLPNLMFLLVRPNDQNLKCCLSPIDLPWLRTVIILWLDLITYLWNNFVWLPKLNFWQTWSNFHTLTSTLGASSTAEYTYEYVISRRGFCCSHWKQDTHHFF